MAGLLVGTASPSRFRAMSVVAKAGDELMEADDSNLNKVMEYIRKRQGPIDSILKEIHDFKHDVAMPASFAVCGDEDMLQMFALKMKGCGTILETSLELRSPTPINREALIMIGNNLKMAALEYEEGLETLDRVVASLKIMCVTSLGCPKDYWSRSTPACLLRPACEGNQVNN
ncbi:hypothetical protein PVAP13_5NG054200 [Panicum virgatum]|uniref:Uncharacterized protein n=1 Tax=Panicum virgatum TaxID=38727 RepID=A0A8T0RK75_PANVG|nr:hypothetical protein PVAP13_5NG054200 [Panicum virgatum]